LLLGHLNSNHRLHSQRRQQKTFRGEGGQQRKKDQKLAKIPKNSTIYLFQGEGGKGKKDPKIAKKAEK